MRLKKECAKMMMNVFVLAALIATGANGQQAKLNIADTSRSTMKTNNAPAHQKLKPQTTCPVLGGLIDSSQYFNYKDNGEYIWNVWCEA
jgi:hypothetical protein